MKIIAISKQFLEKNINDFIDILKDIPHEYWEKENFLAELPLKWNFSYVLLNKDLIDGYIIASKKETKIHIHKFMIKKKLRNLGFGKSLLSHFIEETTQTFDGISLKVYKDNYKAINFYFKNNFYIANQSDELFYMIRKL
ncbi:MAG: GNAT family N-acetyltransferase [Bacteroidales bacterium]|nr:GNAT family N-acetyltransferase [Bacteroidales bacterium]